MAGKNAKGMKMSKVGSYNNNSTTTTTASKSVTSKHLRKNALNAYRDSDADGGSHVHGGNKTRRQQQQRGGDDDDDVGQHQYELPNNFDDEDIDSDDAFDAADDEKYGDFFDMKRQREKQRNGHVDDGNSDTSDGDEGFIDMATLMAQDNEFSSKTTSNDDKISLSIEQPLGLSSNSDGSDGDDDDERHERLLNALDDSKKKRVRVAQRSEGLRESEFSVRTAGVTLNDMLGSLGERKDSLGKSLAKAAQGKQSLSAPLGQATATRITRDAAYSATSTEISKWTATVKKNREAEHLSFPLNATVNPAASTATLDSSYYPITDMEKEVESVLMCDGIGMDTNTKISTMLHSSELEKAGVAAESMQDRVRQMQKMRILLSYAEEKSRREKKIKSKKYHRVKNKALKREAEKTELTLNQLRELDPEAAAERELEEARDRAHERMTMRHKNNSKWAKAMINRGMDTETRQEVSEQLLHGDRLRRKIDGDDVSDCEDSDGSNDGGDGSNDEHEENDELPRTGVFGLQFMRRAVEKKREEAKAALAGIHDELQNDNVVQRRIIGVEKTEILKKRKRHNSDSADEYADDDDDCSDIEGQRIAEEVVKKSTVTEVMTTPEDEAAVNNMLCKGSKGGLSTDKVSNSAGHRSRVDSALTVDLGSSGNVGLFEVEEFPDADELRSDILNQNSIPTLASLNKKSAIVIDDHDSESESSGGDEYDSGSEELSDAEGFSDEDADIVIKSDREADLDDFGGASTESADANVNPWLEGLSEGTRSNLHTAAGRIGGGSSRGTKRQDKIKKALRSKEQESIVDPTRLLHEESSEITFKSVKHKEHENGSDDESGDDSNRFNLGATEAQRNLITRAFAGDDVVAEFEAEKADIVSEGTSKALEEIVVPGWGSWGGDGIKARKKRRKVEQTTDFKSDGSSSRKDANIKHVIFNEKRDKKLASVVVSRVPHPFTSREQYERAMRNPVGKEWNTTTVVEKNTKPKIQTRAGAIIEPINRKIAGKDKNNNNNKRKASVSAMAAKKRRPLR